MLRGLIAGAFLLCAPVGAGIAENVKPDPNGLAPHEIKDLFYGDVLF
jgi:hypothetical protein